MGDANTLLAEFASGQDMTKHFEGYSAYPYNDTTGNQTIGYGFNLTANPHLVPTMVRTGMAPLDQKQADMIFEPLYAQAAARAKVFAGPVYDTLNPKQQYILNDMSYNLNNRLFEFKKMQEALQRGDIAGVKAEMKNSAWFKQTGQRAQHHVREF